MAKRQRHKEVVWVKHERKKFTKHERKFVFEKYNYTCQLCGKNLKDLPHERVLDHKVPLAQLGSNKNHNIWLLCNKCDKEKGAKVLHSVIEERINFLKSRNPK